VARTFGDIEAKVAKYGGNPKVIIATPDIMQFKITDKHDFIVIGSTFFALFIRRWNF